MIKKRKRNEVKKHCSECGAKISYKYVPIGERAFCDSCFVSICDPMNPSYRQQFKDAFDESYGEWLITWLTYTSISRGSRVRLQKQKKNRE